MLNLSTIIRVQVRSILIKQGPKTCSDIVRLMGMDPRSHKGTIHAIMVDLESEGLLGATRKGGKRDLWFAYGDKIRMRDRILSVIIG